MRVRMRQNLECDGEKGIACEHRGCLVELDMRGRLSAAKIVVVHARQVVMDERVGVQRFDRRRHLESPLWVYAEELRGTEHQAGPQALAAGENRIAHGFVNAPMKALGLR